MESLDPPQQHPNDVSIDFATTHWSLVLAAGGEDSPQRKTALSQLCETYWMPLYAYARGRVRETHDAQDLTQAFFERLIEKNYPADADPERGRFRAFLITSFPKKETACRPSNEVVDSRLSHSISNPETRT